MAKDCLQGSFTHRGGVIVLLCPIFIIKTSKQVKMGENTLQKLALWDFGISDRFTKSHGYNFAKRKNLSTALYEKLFYSCDKNKFSRRIVTVPFKRGANVVVRLLRLCFLTVHPLPPNNAQFFVCVPKLGPT